MTDSARTAPQTAGRGFITQWGPALLIAAFVLLLRGLYIGDPVVNIDEQFYLVVADKWFNEGLLPYVDIWDRKPVGIFLIYAPAVLFFKNAVVGYQILGLIAVLATCAVVYQMGLWFGGRVIALAAALFYAAIMMLWSGAGGQTPVFYNLPMAVGALLLMRLPLQTTISRSMMLGSLFGASLLFGIALQIKYICVFEICFLSLTALAYLLASRRVTIVTAAILALGMVILGLLPTIIAGAAYAWAGHWQEFFFANFQSIMGKKTWRFSGLIYLLNLLSAVIYCVIFWIFTGYILKRGLKDRPAMQGYAWTIVSLALWLGGAVFGALMLGNPILHYFLPTAAPLALLSAVGLERMAQLRATADRPAMFWIRRLLGWSMALCTVAAVVIYIQTTQRRGASQVYPIAAYMNEHLDGGCPYVFDDFPILYYLTHCKPPSIYTFPNHLIETAELHALTVDSLTELQRVLDTGPPMIFVRRPYAPEFDDGAIAILEKTLTENYELGKVFPAWHQEFSIYLKRKTTT